MGLASYFSGLKAGCAYVLTLGVAINQRADLLDIRIPATASAAIGVRDVISKAGALATDIAYCCHGRTPCWISNSF